MANKRMFSKEIINTDRFQSMKLSAQALYFHLGINADDDGFCDNPKGIARLAGCKFDAVRELKDAGYVIDFDGGLFVVVHWMQHNYIQKDRYHETRFIE